MNAYPAVVIGCGSMGSQFNETPSYDPRHTHAASYDAHDKTVLVAVCDANAQRVKEAAARWKTQSYIDPAQMLDEKKPVFVSISSPTETHARMLKLALDAPSVKAILCEKPITENLEESFQLVEEAKKKNIHLAVNYSRRFNRGHNKIRDLIAEGALGDLKIARAVYQNGILHNGTHLIDLFRFLFGEIIAARSEYNPDASAKSNLSGILEFENGLKAAISGADMPDITFGEIDIIGTKGRISTSQNGHVIKLCKITQSPLFPNFKAFGDGENISDGLIDNTYNAIQDLLDCLEGERVEPRCTGFDALKAAKAALALVDSARRNERIEVK